MGKAQVIAGLSTKVHGSKQGERSEGHCGGPED